MGKEAFNDDDVVAYNREVIPKLQKVEPRYTVVVRTKSTRIRGGDEIDLGLFLTGIGIPDASKCFIHWGASEFINHENVGHQTSSIKLASKNLKGRETLFPVSGGKFIEQLESQPKGVILGLTKAYFLLRPPVHELHSKDGSLYATMGEFTWDECPPISVHLNSLRTAKSGDYIIDVVLTYVYQDVARQSSDKVVIHVTNWWERNQKWVISAGTLIGFALLILAIVSS